MTKLTAASGTNQYKEHGGGQGLTKTKSLDPTYTTNVTYNSIFEFAKAQNKYHADAKSTQHNDKMLYQSYDGQYIPYKNVAKDNSLKTIQDATLELLVNTCKEEVNKNIFLSKENVILKNKLTVSLDKNVMLTLENKLLKQGSIVNGNSLNNSLNNSLKTNKYARRCYIEDNKMLSNEKKYEVLDKAEKNRNDKNHREQLLKYCLIMLAGFALFGLINYL